MLDEEFAKQGNKEAYKRLIEKNKRYLFNIAISILKDEDDAGDAISSSIIKAFENIHKLKEPKFFKTWLTRILINESKKILISRGRLVSIEEQKIEETFENVDKEEKMDLKNALSKLSVEQYRVIMLFYYNDLKIDDISEILNIPSGTVKSRLNSAKTKLYQELKCEKED